MTGTIARSTIINPHFAVRGDGMETCISISGAIGGQEFAFLHRWKWDDMFNMTALDVYAGNDAELVEAIIRSGGLWDASWQAIKDGGDYTSTVDGTIHAGEEGVSERFADWVSTHTTRECETATDLQWWRGTMLPYLQAKGEEVWGALVDPGPPVPIPVDVLWPPTIKGVPTATTLGIAQGARLTLAPDPHNPTRVIVGTIDVP